MDIQAYHPDNPKDDPNKRYTIGHLGRKVDPMGRLPVDASNMEKLEQPSESAASKTRQKLRRKLLEKELMQTCPFLWEKYTLPSAT